MCDERYYEDYISQPSLHEGDYQTIYDEFYNGTEILVLNKNDHPSVHFECPTIDEIVNVYQREMLKRNEKSIVLPVIITINHIILAVTLCFVFNCIHCRKYKKNTVSYNKDQFKKQQNVMIYILKKKDQYQL